MASHGKIARLSKSRSNRVATASPISFRSDVFWTMTSTFALSMCLRFLVPKANSHANCPVSVFCNTLVTKQGRSRSSPLGLVSGKYAVTMSINDGGLANHSGIQNASKAVNSLPNVLAKVDIHFGMQFLHSLNCHIIIIFKGLFAKATGAFGRTVATFGSLRLPLRHFSLQRLFLKIHSYS